MTICFLTSDLVFSSRAAGIARQLGKSLAVLGSASALLEKCEAESVSLVLLDLSLAKLNVAELLPKLRAVPSPPSAIVAYAPHVHESLLAAAASAGCDEVLTRGQFNGQMEHLLAQYGSSRER